jgi:hypothetical protein
MVQWSQCKAFGQVCATLGKGTFQPERMESTRTGGTREPGQAEATSVALGEPQELNDLVTQENRNRPFQPRNSLFYDSAGFTQDGRTQLGTSCMSSKAFDSI